MPKKHLFIDDAWIEATKSVHRRVGEPVRHPANPVLVPDQPWEAGNIGLYGTVIEDGGILRMWYQVYGKGGDEGSEPPFHGAVGYAESTDGISWTKPRVGLEIAPFGKTNLVYLGSPRGHLYAPSVLRDDTDPDPKRRYKMMVFDAMSSKALGEKGSPFPHQTSVPGWISVEGEGMFVMVSEDGLSWTLCDEQPVMGDPADAVTVSMDPDGGYRAFFKTSLDPERHFRIIATAYSRDFTHWGDSRTILEPDWRDPLGTEFYGMSGFEYASNRVGLLWMYRNAPDDKRNDVQLVTSRDGETWERATDRSVLLEAGPSAQWDAGGVYPASAPVVAPSGAPERIWLYYTGFNVRHDDMRYRESGIGLAELRLDGFAYLEAAYLPGTLTTRPVTPEESVLCLNVEARHGWIAVEILDEDGKLVAHSDALTGVDGTRVEIPMAKGTVEPGTPVRLVIRMRKARLYAFWFEASAA